MNPTIIHIHALVAIGFFVAIAAIVMKLVP